MRLLFFLCVRVCVRCVRSCLKNSIWYVSVYMPVRECGVRVFVCVSVYMCMCGVCVYGLFVIEVFPSFFLSTVYYKK